jgi:hypothetical protein
LCGYAEQLGELRAVVTGDLAAAEAAVEAVRGEEEAEAEVEGSDSDDDVHPAFDFGGDDATQRGDGDSADGDDYSVLVSLIAEYDRVVQSYVKAVDKLLLRIDEMQNCSSQ